MGPFSSPLNLTPTNNRHNGQYLGSFYCLTTVKPGKLNINIVEKLDVILIPDLNRVSYNLDLSHT